MDYRIGRSTANFTINDSKGLFQSLDTDKTGDTDVAKIIDKNDVKDTDVDTIVKTLTAMAEDMISGSDEYQKVFVTYLSELPNMATRDTVTKIKTRLYNALLPLANKYVQSDVEKFYNIKVGDKTIKEYLSDTQSSANFQAIPDNNNSPVNNNNPTLNNNSAATSTAQNNNFKPRFNYLDVYNRLIFGEPGQYFDDINPVEKALIPNYSLGFNFELEPTQGFIIRAMTDISTRSIDPSDNMPPIGFHTLGLGLGYTFNNDETIVNLTKTAKLAAFVGNHSDKFSYDDIKGCLTYRGNMSKSELDAYLSEDLSVSEKAALNNIYQKSQYQIKNSIAALFGVVKPARISSFTDFQRFQYFNDDPGKFGFGLENTFENKNTKVDAQIDFTTPPLDELNDKSLFGIPDPTAWTRGEYEVLYNIALKTKTYQDGTLYFNHYLAAGNKKQAITDVDLSYVTLNLDVAHSFAWNQTVVDQKTNKSTNLEWSLIPDLNYSFTRSWAKDSGAEEFVDHVIGTGAELALKIPVNDTLQYIKPYINIPLLFDYTRYGNNNQTYDFRIKLNPSVGAEFNFGAFGSLFAYLGGNFLPFNQNSYISDTIYNPATGNWDDVITVGNKPAQGFFFGIGYNLPLGDFIKATK